MKKMNLTTKILLALILGAVFGVVLSTITSPLIKQTLMLDGILKLLGTGFLNAIKLLVVPLIFVSIVYATASLDDIKKVGRIGSKTMIFYVATTALAIVVALTVSNIIKPGIGIDLNSVVLGQGISEVTSINFIDTLLQIIPTNIFMAFADGNVLGVLFFAVIVGISITLVGEKAEPVLRLFEGLNEVFLKLVTLIMQFAPYGVFALVATTFATFGFSALMPLVKYAACILLALGIQFFIVYLGMLVFIGKLNPKVFVKKFMPIFNLCFSTASSSAALPLSLESSDKQFGVSKRVSSFTLPLGATINMDGTAIMQGVAVVFIAQIYGIPLGFGDYIMVILTAVLASIGTAGVPGVGLVMLTMVLASVNLPVEGIALIMGIDRILDMIRTGINVAGDNVCTILIAKQENEFDESVYNTPTVHLD
ncbi:MAG: dicarboxylate/amino acid:cation symporter [Niameybacter sp.]|uniref:dicarboxylate/amino acid:cation symporter n=1 Tax=Niameybacter sp. TaxID=2033640 RepID=UPI002FCB7867